MRPCRLIQLDIACHGGSRQEDKKHVLTCRACSEVAARIEELDRLFRNGLDPDIPEGFAERVKEEIEEYKDFACSAPKPFFLTLIYSRVVQWALVGLGLVFGLMKILTFFSGGMI